MRVRSLGSWLVVTASLLAVACAESTPGEVTNPAEGMTPAAGSGGTAGARETPGGAAGTVGNPGAAGRVAPKPEPAAGRAAAGRGAAAGCSGGAAAAGGVGPAAGSGGFSAGGGCGSPAPADGDACPAGFAAPPICPECGDRSCAKPACKNGEFSHWKCPDSAPFAACRAGGCSNQLCGDASKEPLVSTCEWRDEYACYRSAKCERQATTGQCGWTPSPELQACLADPLSMDAGI